MSSLLRFVSKKKGWSSTLQLPKTNFPARATAFDLDRYRVQSTQELYHWQQQSRLPSSGTETFILHDGPPYANGDLHIGHAVNKILKDIICRIQLQKGKAIHYQPGWDCHGLPIELKALEGVRQNAAKFKPLEELSPVAVRKAARALASSTIGSQRAGFQSWGVMGDFQRPYYTMDKNFELDQLRVFKEMVSKNLVFRRFKPVYWSPVSKTALAEAELEYREDHTSIAAFVKFRLSSLPALREKIDQLSIVVWTTTPWTLPANQAVAVNKHMDYVVMNSPTHGNLLFAGSRLKYLQTEIPDLGPNPITQIRGADIAGKATYEGMFANAGKNLPILAADFVTSESGTGVVHCAPGHGMDDYELCQKHEIRAFGPVDDEGKFTCEAWPSEAHLLAGKPVLTEGNMAVLNYLNEIGALLKKQEYQHKYPYDWRSKTPVIIRATKQWFADLGPIRDKALAALENVQFIPESGKARLESFVKNRSEWCISRQRAWGVPIPALYHNETGEALLTPTSVQNIITQIQKHGIDAWWKNDLDDPRWTPLGRREQWNVSKWRRGTDTMDVWFDSGTSWTQINNAVEKMGGRNENQPLADVYIEGTDQHRGWFQSSLLTHIASQSSESKPPKAPFKTLITHGFTLDKDGRKMSKSLGNVVSPEAIMDGTLIAGPDDKPDALGPDVLRLFVASSNYTKDITISPESLKAIHANLKSFRITFKLLAGALSDFDPSKMGYMKHTTLPATDRIALVHLYELNTAVTEAYENLEFHKAVIAIAKWINLDFSALYLESVKDRLYCEPTNSISRRNVQKVLWQILLALQSMLAPITPLLVQESLHFAPNAQLRAKERLPFYGPHALNSAWNDEDLKTNLKFLLLAKNAVKAAQEDARDANYMKSSLESFVHIGLPDSESRTFFEKYLKDSTLEHMFVVSDVTLQDGNKVPEDIRTMGRSTQVDFRVPGAKEKMGRVWVYPPRKEKCGRCWRWKAESGDVDKPAWERLCGRCEDAIKEMEVEMMTEEEEKCEPLQTPPSHTKQDMGLASKKGRKKTKQEKNEEKKREREAKRYNMAEKEEENKKVAPTGKPLEEQAVAAKKVTEPKAAASGSGS